MLTPLNFPKTLFLKFIPTAMKLRCFSQNCVKVCQHDGIREIKLNEPRKRNPLSIEMMDSIYTAINKDLNDKYLRCIVLTAEGNVWSAGHDLKELCYKSESSQQLVIFQKLTNIISSIQSAPIPVIAKVNGVAAAAGCQLVASCDIILASETSTFLTPGANFGVFCSTPGIPISRIMSRPKAAYMLMTGLPLTAQQAFIAGLVSCVAPEKHIDDELNKVTSAIKDKSRAVITLGKEFFYKQLQLPLTEAYCLGEMKMTENLSLDDSQEGLRSFIEKRKPNWKHE